MQVYKNDHSSKILIEAMTSDNKLESYQFEISFKKFKTSNLNFNLSAHLSLLGRINNELKRNIEGNIQRSLDYKLKVNITF